MLLKQARGLYEAPSFSEKLRFIKRLHEAPLNSEQYIRCMLRSGLAREFQLWCSADWEADREEIRLGNTKKRGRVAFVFLAGRISPPVNEYLAKWRHSTFAIAQLGHVPRHGATHHVYSGARRLVKPDRNSYGWSSFGHVIMKEPEPSRFLTQQRAQEKTRVDATDHLQARFLR